MITHCNNCEFYNRPNAPFCLDCGKEDFAYKYVLTKKRKFSFVQTLVLAIFITALITALRYYFTPPGKFDSLQSYFVFTIAFALVAGAIFARAIAVFVSDEEAKTDRTPEFIRSVKGRITLSFLEDEIADQIRILTEENTELLALFQPFDEDEKIEFVETNDSDEKIAELVTVNIALRNMQYKEIFLIGLESDVLYYHENLNDLDENEMDDGDKVVEGSLEELQDWKETLELGEENGYFDIYELAGKGFLKRVEQTQKFCETVREELIIKCDSLQHGVKFVQPQTDYSSGGQLLADQEIGRILTDYQPTFDILITEYKRLKSEDEIGRNLLNE